jgi:GTPase-associated protein 1, N-terminal domain type 2/GTPase-associated protein 1, middle domain
MTAQFAQLTFTSYEPPGGALGGWQVKESELTEDEHAWAMNYVASVLRPVVPIPRFPSDRDRAKLPRRLMFTNKGTNGLLVHCAPAGGDGSGRQGNVFNHVLVDRTMADRLNGTDPWRPIQLWRSAGWLTPYGVEEVQRAGLKDPPERSEELTRSSISRFLTDPKAARLDGLGALLDAYLAQLDGKGPPIVVVVDSLDEGARWIAALSLLAAPQAAMQMTFSTFERAIDLLTSGPKTRLSIMQREDLPQMLLASDARLVVIDPRNQTPAAARTWITANRTTVAETAWSRLAIATCRSGQETLADRMLAVDELSEWNPEPAIACAWWPLAVAVSEKASLRDAWNTAAQVVLQHTPPGVTLDKDTRIQLGRLLEDAAGTTADDAWHLLEDLKTGAQANAELLSGVYGAYLRRVMEDHEVLLAPSPPRTLPVAEQTAFQGDVVEAINAQLPSIKALVASDEDWAAVLVRYLDLASKVGLHPNSGGLLRELLERLALVLCEPVGARVIEITGPVQADVLRLIGGAIDAVLPRVERPLGERVPGALLTWLGALDRARLADPTRDESPLAQEAIVWLARHEEAQTSRLSTHAAVLVLASDPSDVRSRDRVGNVLRAVWPSHEWSPAELDSVAQGVGRGRAAEFVNAASSIVRVAGPGKDSTKLAVTVLDQIDETSTPPDDDLEILRLARALASAWEKHLTPPIVQTIAAAARLCQDEDRFEPADRERWAPAILTAGAIVAIAAYRNETGTEGTAQNDEPPPAKDMFCELAKTHGHLAVPDLIRMLDVDEGLAVGLFLAAARLKALLGVETVPDSKFLVEQFDTPPDSDLATQTLLDYLAKRDNAGFWLEGQLDALSRMTDMRARHIATTWARSLLPGSNVDAATAPLTQGK